MRLAFSGFAPRLRSMLPKVEPAQAIMMGLPDILGAGMTAYGLSKTGATPGGIALATAEDLGLGLLGTALGGFAGNRAARFANKTLGKNWDPRVISTVGDYAVSAPIMMGAPRPAYNAAIEDVYSRQQQQQDAQAAFEQQKLQEQLLMGAGYGLGGYGLSMGPRMV